MPTATFAVWTCSRCGTEETVNPKSRPVAWRLALIEHYDPGIARDYTGDLCGDCRFKLVRFLEGADLAPEEDDA